MWLRFDERKAVGRNIKKLRDSNKKGDKEKVRDIKAAITEENRGGGEVTSGNRVIFEKLDLDKSSQDTLSQNNGNWCCVTSHEEIMTKLESGNSCYHPVQFAIKKYEDQNTQKHTYALCFIWV